MILYISVVSAVISVISDFIYLDPLFFLVSMDKDLPILLIFSKNHLFVLIVLKLIFLSRLNQEEIQNINKPITSNEIKSVIKKTPGGFPGGAVVENLPANAGDTGFEPWSGKIPHAAEQLGP